MDFLGKGRVHHSIKALVRRCLPGYVVMEDKRRCPKFSTNVRALTDLIRKRTEVHPTMRRHAENEGEAKEATEAVQAGSNSADAGSLA